MRKMMFNDRYGLTRAVIEGEKTMTRQIINPSPKGELRAGMQDPDGTVHAFFDSGEDVKSKYKIGEIVAVAQSYRDIRKEFLPNDFTGKNKWGNAKIMKGWSNKMFVRADVMPHQIRITDIRCEQLQDITDNNCIGEGIKMISVGPRIRYTFTNMSRSGYNNNPIRTTPREAFALLIDKVSGRGTWAKNPYVWVYEFELVK